MGGVGGTAELLSLPLSKKAGLGLPSLHQAPREREGKAPSGRGQIEEPRQTRTRAQRLGPSYPSKRSHTGRHSATIHRCVCIGSPARVSCSLGYLIQPWRGAEVHPTHLGVGHYLPGKLEQASPGLP